MKTWTCRFIVLSISTLLLLSLLSYSSVYGQRVTVSGKVVDTHSKDPIPFATIYIKDVQIGVSTDENGAFELKTSVVDLPFDLVISATDYDEEEIRVYRNNSNYSIALRHRPTILRDNVSQAANLQSERILESPISVEYLDERTLKAMPTVNFYEAVGYMKDVQLNTNSITFNSVNSRGYATFNNGRFVQYVDGVNNAPPGLGFALGNLLTVSDLDIESIELIPGTASVFYGGNAFNGTLFINTKDPFRYQGLDASLKAGISLQEETGNLPFYEASARFAKVVGPSNNIAFKISFSAMMGQDWHATDSTDIDRNMINEDNRGPGSPSYDGVNIYGDEISTTVNVDEIVQEIIGSSLNLPPIHIARTGYWESDLFDYNVNSFKVGGSVNIRLTEKLELKGGYRFGRGTSIYQGTNRNALKNISLHQLRLELKDPNFSIRAYNTFENSGDSYDMRFAAWNINRTWKSDLDWFTDYTQGYLEKILGINVPQATTPEEAHDFARAMADEGRILPTDPEFLNVRDSILQITDLSTGSKITDKSSLFRVDGVYNFKQIFKPFEFQVGANFQRYRLNSEGTLFNDADGPISITEFGTFAQAGKQLFKNKPLKISASIRYDKNENFDPILSYRSSAVLTLGEERDHNFRVNYQTGFRYPDPPGQFIALDLGVARSIGGTEANVEAYSLDVNYIDQFGLPQTTLVSGSDIYSNSYTEASVNDFLTSYADSLQGGFSPSQAARLNASKLQAAELEFIRPEKITSFEIGYKGMIADQLLIDLNYYQNQYTDFHIFSNVVHALTGNIDDNVMLSGVDDVVDGRTTTFEVIKNAEGKVTAHGFTLGLNYAFRNTFSIGGNYSFLTSSFSDDANPEELPGQNAPTHSMVYHFGTYETLGKSNFGFMIFVKWLDDYDWKARFANGKIENIFYFDMQCSYHIPQVRTTVRLGAANAFNRQYRQAVGTPNQGSRFYISLTYNGSQKYKR